MFKSWAWLEQWFPIVGSEGLGRAFRWPSSRWPLINTLPVDDVWREKMPIGKFSMHICVYNSIRSQQKLLFIHSFIRSFIHSFIPIIPSGSQDIYKTCPSFPISSQCLHFISLFLVSEPLLVLSFSTCSLGIFFSELPAASRQWLSFSVVPSGFLWMCTIHYQLQCNRILIYNIPDNIKLKYNYLFWLFTIVPFKIDLKSIPRSAFVKKDKYFNKRRASLKMCL